MLKENHGKKEIKRPATSDKLEQSVSEPCVCIPLSRYRHYQALKEKEFYNSLTRKESRILKKYLKLKRKLHVLLYAFLS